MKHDTHQAHPGETRRMTRRSLIASAAALCTLSLISLTGCASSDSDRGPAPDGAAQPSAGEISRDASEQIARLRAEEARRLREALALGEKGDRAYAAGQALKSTGDDEEADAHYAEAVGFYSQAVSTYDDFFALWNNLGTALMALDRFHQAEEAFIRASAINPSDPRPLYNRGLLWRERGYPHDARRYFERALDQDDKYLDALWGSIRADITTRSESRETLERIRTALFLVTDPQHRRFLELERERITSKLDNSRSDRDRSDRDGSDPDGSAPTGSTPPQPKEQP